MNKPITIAVDAMGGEKTPNKTIEGISLHSKSSSGIFIIFMETKILLIL